MVDTASCDVYHAAASRNRGSAMSYPPARSLLNLSHSAMRSAMRFS